MWLAVDGHLLAHNLHGNTPGLLTRAFGVDFYGVIEIIEAVSDDFDVDGESDRATSGGVALVGARVHPTVEARFVGWVSRCTLLRLRRTSASTHHTRRVRFWAATNRVHLRCYFFQNHRSHKRECSPSQTTILEGWNEQPMKSGFPKHCSRLFQGCENLSWYTNQ